MVKKTRNFFKKNFLLVTSLMFLVVFSGTMQLFAADPPPPVGGYPVGSGILDPGCTPGSANCIVAQAVYNAGDIVYDNLTSGLTATDVQGAIDEIDGVVDGITGGTGFTFDSNRNMFAGADAGFSLSGGTGYDNFFAGEMAGYNTIDGAYNLAIGNKALYSSNSNTSYNIAIGYRNLYSNTTGWGNTAIGGANVLEFNTIGTYNSAIGNATLFQNITGSYNNAFGHQSLYKNNSGNYNAAFGYYSLHENISGNYNNANGYRAIYNNTTGNQNSSFGSDSLFSNTTGSFNNAFGYQALFTNTTGSYNTAIGYAADVTVNNLTNATAIGYNAKVGASNSLVLGGTGADAVNVGIGMTVPTARLTVSDTTTAGPIASFTNSDGTCTLDPSDITGWSCPSDRNLKKDINNLELGLSELNQLRPVAYRLINEDESTSLSMGLIAQEVEPIFPKLVKTQKDGTLALNYGGLTPIMIKAIQELDLKVEDLVLEKQNLFSNLISWFGNVENGITDFFANRIRTKELCISDETGETCISRSQLDQILTNSGTVGSAPVVSITTNTNNTGTNNETPDSEADLAPEEAVDTNVGETVGATVNEGEVTETVVTPTE